MKAPPGKGSTASRSASGSAVAGLGRGRPGRGARGLFAQCETTQNYDQGKGASLFGFTSLYGAVPGGQAERVRVPHADCGPVTLPPEGADSSGTEDVLGLESLATHRVPLDQAPEMYDTFQKNTDGCLKVVLKPEL